MPLRGDDYDARFARFEAEGLYLHGEADLVTGLLGEPPALVLDAGCGTGRVAIELARRGFDTVGIDVEPSMLDAARAKAPDLEWILGDLSSTQLPDAHFDLVVAAGNVMIFLELGTEAAVTSNLARTVVPGGLVVAGFQVGRQLTLERYDELSASVGLELVHRWATWDRAAYDGGDYAVSVHRREKSS
ncbi:MAG TPA: class I SAM-dependent methyltransferase [Acidimicrobiales bacterium]|nr:class I SAM-dependent methyltransferase [Acidimicrobiales bacterium]